MSIDLIGLDEQAVAVYHLALARRTCDPDVLSSWLRWSVETVRAALATLVDRGLCVPSQNGEYVLHPEDAAELHDARVSRAAANLSVALAEESARLRSGILGQYGSGRLRPTTTSGVELVPDAESLDLVMAEMSRRSRRQVDFLAPLPEEGVYNEAAVVNVGLAARGIRMRGVWFERQFPDRPPSPGVRRLAMAGGVRTVDGFPMKAIVWDESVALIPQDPADFTSPPLLIAQPALVAIVSDMIEHHWARGVPWIGFLPSKELSTRQRTILGLLVEGLTDEAISRRLGIGERTVRRDVAHLMDTLGVSSRVTLGAEAIRRKLVSG